MISRLCPHLLPPLLDWQRKRVELTEQKEKLSQKNLSQKIRNRFVQPYKEKVRFLIHKNLLENLTTYQKENEIF